MELRIQPFEFTYTTHTSGIIFPGFTIEQGMIAFLSGENGAGKTTFLNYLRSTVGTIALGNAAARCCLINQMYEELVFPYKPVWWNVALPRIITTRMSRQQKEDLAKQQLETFSLNIDLHRYPAKLSGGEKHLIVLARLGLCNHDVVLVDEPTASLDQARSRMVWSVLNRLVSANNKWVLVTSHAPPSDPSTTAVEFPGINSKTLKLQAVVVPHQKETNETPL